jgi:hypothetical protein
VKIGFIALAKRLGLVDEQVENAIETTTTL